MQDVNASSSSFFFLLAWHVWLVGRFPLFSLLTWSRFFYLASPLSCAAGLSSVSKRKKSLLTLPLLLWWTDRHLTPPFSSCHLCNLCVQKRSNRTVAVLLCQEREKSLHLRRPLLPLSQVSQEKKTFFSLCTIDCLAVGVSRRRWERGKRMLCKKSGAIFFAQASSFSALFQTFLYQRVMSRPLSLPLSYVVSSTLQNVVPTTQHAKKKTLSSFLFHGLTQSSLAKRRRGEEGWGLAWGFFKSRLSAGLAWEERKGEGRGVAGFKRRDFLPIFKLHVVQRGRRGNPCEHQSSDRIKIWTKKNKEGKGRSTNSFSSSLHFFISATRKWRFECRFELPKAVIKILRFPCTEMEIKMLFKYFIFADR